MGVNLELLLALSTVLVLTYFTGVWGEETTQQICSQRWFRATCEANKFIYISSAWYGRKKGKCVTTWSEDCGCDATKSLRGLCAGHRNCTKEVLDKHLPCKSKSTCASDYTQHLYVTYGCGENAQPHKAMSASQKNWIIIGSIAGGVVFIIIVVIAFRCWQQHNYNEDAESARDQVYYQKENRDPPQAPVYAEPTKKKGSPEESSADSIAKDKYEFT